MSAPSARRWAIGPGIVHLVGSVGPNDLIANSVIGAMFGYSLLWALVPAYALNFFITEASSRYVLATGESAMEGYRRLGRPLLFTLAGTVLLRRLLNNIGTGLIIGQAIHLLLPLPLASSAIVWSLIATAAAYAWMFHSGYPGIEWVARPLTAILILSMAIVVFIAGPAPLDIVKGLAIPVVPGPEATVLLMALAGTAVGSINHLKYPAYVYEKGWRNVGATGSQRRDLLVSVAGQFFLASLIQIAAAAALYGTGARIRSIENLSMVFSSQLGEAGRIVLGIGLIAVTLSSYLGSNTGYGFIVADIYERFVRRGPKPTSSTERDRARLAAYRVVLTVFCVTPIYGLFTDWEGIWITLAVSALFFGLAPLMMLGLLRLTSNRELMGLHVNGLASKVALILAAVISIGLTYRSLGDVVASLIVALTP